MIKAVFFDLDGTLVNTVTDLGNAVDVVLNKHGFDSPYTEDDYKQMVGDGAAVLLERAFWGLGYRLTALEKKAVLAEFKAQYSIHLFDNTTLYDGIFDLLEWIKKAHFKVAVITNKPEENAKQMIDHYFLRGTFDYIAGQREGVPIKPNPANIDFALAHLHLHRDEAIFVGDSNTDIKTAQNAGMVSVGAAWGFRGEEELRKERADYIAHNPWEIKNILLSYNH